MKALKKFGIEINSENYFEGTIYGVACAYSLIERKISDHLRPFDLTPAKFNALMVIKHRGKDEGLSQVQIGRKLIVTESNMTRLLDRLNNDGFIERFPQKNDRRVNLIKITKKGSDLLDLVWPGYYQKIREIAGYLNTQEQKQLSSQLIKWCDKIGEVNGKYTYK